MVDARTIAVYDKSTADYVERFGAWTPNDDLKDFIALLPQGATVLDLGCGPAFASAHMRDAGCRVDPVDASDGMIAVANDLHDIGARKLTFDEIDMVAAYDGVWANFSLLHAPRDDLPGHLAAIATALRPGGVFHVGLKTGTGQARDKLDRFYTYVTVEELEGLLTDAGFDVIAQVKGEGAGMAGEIEPWVILRSKKR